MLFLGFKNKIEQIELNNFLFITMSFRYFVCDHFLSICVNDSL